MPTNPLHLYRRRQALFRQKLGRAQSKSNGISWLRLLFFILAAGAFAYGVYTARAGFYLAALPLAAVFVLLVIKHIRLKEEMEFLQKLVQVNEKACLRLEGKWTGFAGRGERYTDDDHPYSTDLNIFGQGSLFQYLNDTISFQGERLLAEQLSRPQAPEQIKLRQEAVADLAGRLDFRQYFQAAGMDDFFKRQDPQTVLAWAESKVYPLGWKSMLLFLPALTFSLFALGFLGFLPYLPALILLAMQIAAALPGEKKNLARFTATDQAMRRLKPYAALLRYIEQEKFKAPLLKALRKRLFSAGQPASGCVHQLVRIAERNNLRFSNSLIYLVLKYAFLWDLWTLKMLDDWQKNYGRAVRGWFAAAAEIEALASLAGLCHDHPRWVFPRVKAGPPALKAKGLGHPLIAPAKRVANDISLSGAGRFIVITGSNMSGKSTFLRTVGVNLVLAYAGAPVCAAECECSLMRIYTKMHSSDNLEKGISTFYGELLRMKMIMDAAARKAPLLILLDEIFRGTNPRDRILATRNIIGQLLRQNVIGMLTTHDLELGELEKEYPGSIRNYHFTDEIRAGEIHFDYKIKPGLAQTANALALMKLVGIKVEKTRL